MIKVKYIGSRACKLNGTLWNKYDEREMSEELYNKVKNQGFELVKEEKVKPVVIKKKEIEENEEDIFESEKIEE